MTIENARIALEGAVQWARQHGYNITYGITAAPTCCCPMGAVALMAGRKMQNIGKRTIAEVLSVSVIEVGTFMAGFDYSAPFLDDYFEQIEPEWYQLGRELRRLVDEGGL